MSNTAKMYCQVFGIILVAVGLLDIVFPGLWGLFAEQTWLTSVVLTLGGAYVAYVGYSGGESSQMRTAQVLGVIALVAAVLGFVAPGVLDTIFITDGTNLNVLYALTGLAGVYAGWMTKKA